MATAQIDARDGNAAASRVEFDEAKYEELCGFEVIDILGINYVDGSAEHLVLGLSFTREPWIKGLFILSPPSPPISHLEVIPDLLVERLLQVTRLYSRSPDYGYYLLLEVLVTGDADMAQIAGNIFSE
jgi:hypothetical protein